MGIIGYRIGLESLGGLDSRIIETESNITELLISSQASAGMNDPLKDHDTADAIGNYSNEVIIT